MAGKSSLGVRNRLGGGQSGVRIPTGAKHFFLLQNVETCSGAQPPLSLKWLPGFFPPGLKWPGRNADYSPTSFTDVYVFLKFSSLNLNEYRLEVREFLYTDMRTRQTDIARLTSIFLLRLVVAK